MTTSREVHDKAKVGIYPTFKGTPIDPYHPVVYWEGDIPDYVMPHTDEVYGFHPGSLVDKDKDGNIIFKKSPPRSRVRLFDDEGKETYNSGWVQHEN